MSPTVTFNGVENVSKDIEMVMIQTFNNFRLKKQIFKEIGSVKCVDISREDIFTRDKFDHIFMSAKLGLCGVLFDTALFSG